MLVFLYAGVGRCVVVGVPDEYIHLSADSVIAELNRNGFWEAKVDSSRNDTIFVSPGRAAIVESVKIIVSDSCRNLNVEKLQKIFAGDTVKSEKIFSQQEDFVSLLENSGYPFASCTTAVDVYENPSKIGVFLKFIIDEGEFVRLSRIHAEVDGKTKESVIAHLMLFHPEEIYRQQYIDEGTKRLRRSGIVSVDGSPYPALDPEGKWTLVVKAKDLPSTSISGIVGYADDILSGDFEFSAKNIFGTGRRASFYLYASEGDREIEFFYREPFIFKYNIAPQFYSLWEKHDSTYFSREHKLGVEFPLSFKLDGYLGFLTSRTVPGSAGASIDQSESFGLEANAKFSSLDNPILPRRGFMFKGSATAEYIHRWGDEDVEEPGSRGEFFSVDVFPVSKIISLWTKLHGWGWIVPTIPPSSDWGFLGGWSDLRGYRENQFSGCKIANASVEPRFVFQNTFHIFPFVDFGAFRDDEGWNVKFGYGAGIEYLFGAGVFSIEYGIGEGRTPSSGLLHFGIRMEM